MQTQTPNKPFGEVVESSLHAFTVQGWQWDSAAPFGSLVLALAQEKTLFGVVHQVSTGSIDPSRTPFTYQKTPEQLRAEQPQIFSFLKTTISCIAVGYTDNKRILYQLAPHPAPLHTFVAEADTPIAQQFFASDHYLQILFAHAGRIEFMDELLLAILSRKAAIAVLTPARLRSFMNTFALLAGNDYRRTKLFMERAQLLLQSKHGFHAASAQP